MMINHKTWGILISDKPQFLNDNSDSDPSTFNPLCHLKGRIRSRLQTFSLSMFLKRCQWCWEWWNHWQAQDFGNVAMWIPAASAVQPCSKSGDHGAQPRCQVRKPIPQAPRHLLLAGSKKSTSIGRRYWQTAAARSLRCFLKKTSRDYHILR